MKYERVIGVFEYFCPLKRPMAMKETVPAMMAKFLHDAKKNL